METETELLLVIKNFNLFHLFFMKRNAIFYFKSYRILESRKQKAQQSDLYTFQ